MTTTDIVLVLATVTVGVTTGVMFCYQVAVMPGLHQLGDREFVAAFQQLDRKIVNPLFTLVAFLGGGALLVAGTVLAGTGSDRFAPLLAATLLYGVGVVVLTMTWHVPRNAALDRVPAASAPADEVARARARFEPSWNRLHGVRTVTAVAALALLAVATAS